MSNKRLYILRHGNAEQHNFSNDPARRLTPKGIEEVQRIAAQFCRQQEGLQQVYVSPYRRAQETADYFLTTLSALGQQEVDRRETLDIITPSGDPMDVAVWLSQQQADSILLVTHQPFATQLVDLLADEPLPPDFMMRTGSMAALEGELFATACCHFRWIQHAGVGND
ncbi:phosphohistidine phosphatase SixA [Marinomonas agarivorans]|nr:phosphohistidine phosphatase SixA [Marinomonas agarivorans]